MAQAEFAYSVSPGEVYTVEGIAPGLAIAMTVELVGLKLGKTASVAGMNNVSVALLSHTNLTPQELGYRSPAAVEKAKARAAAYIEKTEGLGGQFEETQNSFLEMLGVERVIEEPPIDEVEPEPGAGEPELPEVPPVAEPQAAEVVKVEEPTQPERKDHEPEIINNLEVIGLINDYRQAIKSNNEDRRLAVESTLLTHFDPIIERHINPLRRRDPKVLADLIDKARDIEERIFTGIDLSKNDPSEWLDQLLGAAVRQYTAQPGAVLPAPKIQDKRQSHRKEIEARGHYIDEACLILQAEIGELPAKSHESMANLIEATCKEIGYRSKELVGTEEIVKTARAWLAFMAKEPGS